LASTIYLCPIDPDRCEYAVTAGFCANHPGTPLKAFRAALGPGAKDAGGAVPQTVPHRSVRPAGGSANDAMPKLALRVLGRVIPVPREGVLLGREAPAVRDLPGMAELQHVGRQHAHVYWGSDGLEVIDLRSMNGTFLDGRQILAPERLRPGQTIGLAGDLDIDVVELDEYSLPEVRSDG
jgi:hypothetical protein